MLPLCLGTLAEGGSEFSGVYRKVMFCVACDTALPSSAQRRDVLNLTLPLC